MRGVLKLILGILFYSVAISWATTASATTWFTQQQDREIKIRVDLFLSSTCPHCHKADEFFHQLEPQMPWLDVHRHMINQDKEALALFSKYLKQQQAGDFIVPSIFFCDSRWTGFTEAQTSGKQLLRGLNYCYEQISTTGDLNPETIKVLRQWANANWLETSLTFQPSAVPFLLMTAITDGLNPCSLFGVLALFSFVWLGGKRSSQLAIGIVFIIVAGLVHYIQQVHAPFFYQYLHWLRVPGILAGLALLAYLFKGSLKGFKKPLLIILTLASFSAIILQAYQQICMPNFALVFEQWLSGQQFSMFKIVAFQITYQVVYLLPLLILILILIFLKDYGRLKKHQTLLTKTAQLSLAVIALFLIFYPQGFSQFFVSAVVLLLVLILAWLIKRRSVLK
ncbi:MULTISPECIES: hypothetical protein [unclassified Legionella]|uniref:glutaredoxin family protein n=1 Tax=unclassified Legionella TaxID=2622702 RepID=UPI0010552C80|nr:MULTISPECIES: hypothetical protein [unclassified Legionella]MDI9817734.1 hypothetical protein [Legionella sp. PL877]